MIPQSFIQELLQSRRYRRRGDRHVKLKRAGANYVGVLPVPRRENPFLHGEQSKQFYHCFGCGAHGTAIGFVMEYNVRALSMR